MSFETRRVWWNVLMCFRCGINSRVYESSMWFQRERRERARQKVPNGSVDGERRVPGKAMKSIDRTKFAEFQCQRTVPRQGPDWSRLSQNDLLLRSPLIGRNEKGETSYNNCRLIVSEESTSAGRARASAPEAEIGWAQPAQLVCHGIVIIPLVFTASLNKYTQMEGEKHTQIRKWSMERPRDTSVESLSWFYVKH